MRLETARTAQLGSMEAPEPATLTEAGIRLLSLEPKTIIDFGVATGRVRQVRLQPSAGSDTMCILIDLCTKFGLSSTRDTLY